MFEGSDQVLTSLLLRAVQPHEKLPGGGTGTGMCHPYEWVFEPKFSKQGSLFRHIFHKHGWVGLSRNWRRIGINGLFSTKIHHKSGYGYLSENRAADPRPSASHALPPPGEKLLLNISTEESCLNRSKVLPKLSSYRELRASRSISLTLLRPSFLH